ncbi:MAG: Dabb family protein [Pseudolysinimonas sp.]
MIRHLVMWKLAAEDPEQKAADAAGIKSRLEALVPLVDGLESLTVSFDLGDNPGNWDAVLESDCVDAAALERYLEHPDHVVAAAWLKTVVASRSCVDFAVA